MPIAEPRWTSFAACRNQSWKQRSGWSSCDFLDNGIDIYVEETPFNTVGVDTEDDLRQSVKKWLQAAR